MPAILHVLSLKINFECCEFLTYVQAFLLRCWLVERDFRRVS